MFVVLFSVSFVLAYLETLVRIADWRASGGRELPVAHNSGR